MAFMRSTPSGDEVPTSSSPVAPPVQDEHQPIRHSWSESGRFVPRTFVRPAQRFMEVEAAGGLVMLAAAVVALVWANSPWSAGYDSLWETPVRLAAGSAAIELPLRDWVNDALMALFFLVVALEIKRELVVGDLRDPKVAALPAMAAVGGMVVPALLYLAANAGHDGSRGWGIPMATDIAFAVGVVSLLGRRVPTGAKLFLLTLAIVDDLGAIVVIAVFYTDDLSLPWLGLALLAVAGAVVLRRADVRHLMPYALLGVGCWIALHASGVHATVAGAAFGFLTPAWSFYDPRRLAPRARRLVDDIDAAMADDVLDTGELERNDARMRDLVRLTRESESPLDRVVTTLNPWVSFAIVPLFALANAGVSLSGDALGDALGSRVTIGVALGLLVGKPVGVFGATWLACRLGLGRLPGGTGWRHLFGVGVCAGVGFTVALFVTGLSFDDAQLIDDAKIGILGGSIVAGVLGYLVLRRARPPAPVAGQVREPAMAGV
jgi:Na+:H+ antiporter, NhaA family